MATLPQQGEKPAARSGRSKTARVLVRFGWLAVLSVLLVGLFGGSFYVAMRLVFAGREVTVPDLSGLAVDEARATLNRSDLYLETVAEKYDGRVPKGHVQSQEPPAGSTIKKNRKVRVSVSLGPLEVTIPDLTGQTLRTARIALQRGRLSVGRVTSTYTARVPGDAVMAQHPPATGAGGAGVASPESVRASDGQAAVDLLVSKGRRDPVYVMPDLTGRRLDEVSDFVRRAGLRMGAVRRQPASGVARGAVVKQYPESGYPVGRQEIISLVVSD